MGLKRRYYFWKFIHNGIVHGWLMSWPWEPAWVMRLHDWTSAKMDSEPLALLTVTEQPSGYYIAELTDLRLWAGGHTVDAALGNWLRTHQRAQGFKIRIHYGGSYTTKEK